MKNSKCEELIIKLEHQQEENLKLHSKIIYLNMRLSREINHKIHVSKMLEKTLDVLIMGGDDFSQKHQVIEK